MNRVDALPDNSISTFLSGLEKQANELKSSVQFTGGGSLIYKQSDTGATYDWSGTAPHGGGGQPYNAQFLITATATAQAVLLADLVWQMWVNGVQTTRETNSSNYTIYAYPKTSTATNKEQWYVFISWPNNTDTIAVKAYMLGTDAVTITVAAL